MPPRDFTLHVAERWDREEDISNHKSREGYTIIFTRTKYKDLLTSSSNFPTTFPKPLTTIINNLQHLSKIQGPPSGATIS